MKALTLASNNVRNIIAQLFKFGLVGIINTFLTLVTIYILTNFLGFSYITSNVIGYVIGFINSFILNKKWTFKSKGPIKKETISFIGVFLVCYSLQLGFLILLKSGVHLSANLSQIISMAVYTILNFLGNRLLVFSEGKLINETYKRIKSVLTTK